MFRPRRSGQGLAIGLLLLQLFNVGFENIPPVTLVTIAANVAIYLELLKFHLPWLPLSPSSACVSLLEVYYKEDWKRLFLAAFYHLDEWHLYYNMASFLWKGIQLERKFGSVYFAYLITVFSILVNSLLLALNYACEEYFQNRSYFYTCAAGFSGVIFALKVLSTYYSPASTDLLLGFIPVPSRYACWAELVLIQLLIPNVSFQGHLAGILVGLAYIKGPLKFIMDLPLGPGRIFQTWPFSGSGRRRTSGGSQGNTLGSGRPTDMSRGDIGHHGYNNYAEYTGGLNEEEQINAAVQQSLNSVPRTHPTAPPPPNSDVNHMHNSSSEPPPPSPHDDVPMRANADEIRRRRLARLERMYGTSYQ